MRYHTKNLLRISLSIGLFVLLFLLPVSKDTEQVVSLTPLLAHAASCPAGQVPDGEGGCITYEDQRPKDPNASSTTPGTTGGGTQDVSCSWTSGVQCFVGKLFYYTVFITFGFLVYIAASFFDFVLQLSIIDFHTWVGMPGVRIAWTVLRDTINILFIFLLLYASISMILGLGKEKGIIKGVILAGLLINFSFFFTSAIIDVSNVTTVQMYEAIKRIGENASQQSSNSDVEARMTGITAVFMQGTGIQVSNIAGLNGKEFTSKLFQQMFFSSIEFLVLAFVFFAMGFLLLGRFIVLLILLVTSPISVMGGLLPQLSQYSKQWWKEMINQATFAPIMMLFLVVTAVIVSNPEFRNGFSRDSIGGLVGGVQGLAQYAIVIGLLIVGIITAKQSAGAASNSATDWATKKAGSLTFGGLAAAGSYGIGRYGKKLADSDWANRLKASDNIIGQKIGSSVTRFGTAVGKASYDPRGFVPGAGKAAPGYIDRMKMLDKERKEAGGVLKNNMESAARAEAAALEKAQQARFKNIDNEIQTLGKQKAAALSDSRRADLSPGEQNRARIEAANLQKQIEAAQRFKQRGPIKESAVRDELSAAAKEIGVNGVARVRTVLDDKELAKTLDTIKDPSEKMKELMKHLNEKEVRYYTAMRELIDVEKQKGAQEKAAKEGFAATNADATSKTLRELADKTRKELSKNQQEKVYEAVMEAFKKESGETVSEQPKEETLPAPEQTPSTTTT